MTTVRCDMLKTFRIFFEKSALTFHKDCIFAGVKSH